jgi:GMP synthase-like glutamine amidotransferase
MILVIDMSWKKNSLLSNEFVSPIYSVLNQLEECEVKHFLDVKNSELEGYSKVVLSGTALKDNATLKQVDKFQWIKTCDKPILGICAGMQTIALVFGVPLTTCLQIGMTEISTLKENQLFRGKFKAYTLHNYSVKVSTDFETLAQSLTCIQAIKHKQKNIYGVLFHPEVRNQEILERFIQQNLCDLPVQ